MTTPSPAAYEHAVRLHNRAAQCQSAGEPVRPEKLYLRALALKERLFGPNHLETGLTLNNLGLYYKSVGRLAEARNAYLRALAIFEKALGGSDPTVGDLLYNLAQLARKESEAFENRARMIQEAADELANESWREKALIRPESMLFRLTVGPSRIHRFGVFAAEPIPAGVNIIEYTGERVSRKQWVKRCKNRTYLLKLDKYWCIDGSVGGSGAELINHCCEPNCKFAGDGGRMWIVSLRSLEAGEELTLDYRFPKAYERVTCYCGAPSCRGTINVR
jgi:uncharacterized protein